MSRVPFVIGTLFVVPKSQQYSRDTDAMASPDIAEPENGFTASETEYGAPLVAIAVEARSEKSCFTP